MNAVQTPAETGAGSRRKSADMMHAFDRRYRLKKYVNLVTSLVIVILGTTSFRFGIRLEPSPTIFRWMTVDGTLFTTFSALFFIGVNAAELLFRTEMTRKTVYYLRLSSAVTEAVILIVVFLSQLPFFDEHLPVTDRYDSFAMHVLIPVLCVVSFLINDSPIGWLKPSRRWHGTWFVTCYSVGIIWLISTGRLSEDTIPFFFWTIGSTPLRRPRPAFSFTALPG